MRLVTIVEGHADVIAVPILLQRIFTAIAPDRYIDIPRPIRLPRTKLLVDCDARNDAIAVASARCLQPEDGVLFVFDADRSCPAQEAPTLLNFFRSRVKPRPTFVNMACCEFENWFIASANSLSGKRGLPKDLEIPVDPESIRGAKEWLKKRSFPPRYSEMRDQPALAAQFDLALCRENSPSFDKLWRDMESFLKQ